MIDIHSHILYGIDDGSKSLECSLSILKQLKEIGFNKVILTPHYMKGSEFVCENSEKKGIMNDLKEELLKKNIDIDLYLGNEIYINDMIHEDIMSKKISTINNSRYILVELPLYNKVNNLDDVIYDLKIKGYKIIIAHPERYSYFQENYDRVVELYDMGVLFQCNYGSVIEKYGKEAKKLIKFMFKNNMVDFMGTDIHKDTSIELKEFPKIRKKIMKYIGEEGFKRISEDNPLKVINDEDI